MLSFGRLKRILPSVVQALVKLCFSLALINCAIFSTERLSVMLTPVPFIFLLFAKNFFQVLYLNNKWSWFLSILFSTNSILFYSIPYFYRLFLLFQSLKGNYTVNNVLAWSTKFYTSQYFGPFQMFFFLTSFL